MSLPAVLHPEIVNFIREIPQSSLKKKIWNCIEKVREQQFNSGLRVKKLKGINKKVWEARITKASRLIFTYEKSREPETGTAQIYIAVQDICLDHDDVSRNAKARKRTPDTEWLDAEIIETIGNIESPRLTIKQKSALQAVRDEELTLPAEFQDELLSNIPWQVIDSEEAWTRAIIAQDSELPLKLTPEEYQLVQLPGTLLLSGSAGTGKTTVALYRLLQSLQTSPAGKRLYIAQNPLLVANAREQFKKLLGNSQPSAESIFEFKTMRDLCLEILESAAQPYRPENEVNFQAFCLIYRAHPKRKQYPSALIWDEIRSIIKGSQLSPNLELISEKDYEKLGKKSLSVITQNQRREVYALGEWYQKKLKQTNSFDEIDVARNVIRILKQKPQNYHFIVCDEVQDFTELHLELLLQLAAPGSHFFFAGDLNQTISPSGFRWEDLKQKFYRQNQQVLEKTLYFNFRSVGSLVHLANQFLILRGRLLKVGLAEIPEQAKNLASEDRKIRQAGEPARLISATPTALKETLQELNPGDAILVRTEEEKDKFSIEFQSTLIFTVEEAKGLEFDTVFLTEFFFPSQDLWGRFFRNGIIQSKETPQLQLELNLLYVAITRARRILNIWETELSPVWQQPELTQCVLPLAPELVQQSREAPTAESWQQRGLYYFKAEFYRQAIECFEKAGDLLNKTWAEAKYFAQQKQYSKAAELFAQLSQWETAASLFEQDKEWEKAAECWGNTENKNQQIRCEIAALEIAGDWESAAQKWQQIGEAENAKRCWLKSNNETKKSQYKAEEFEQKKQWQKAAEYYDIAQLTHKAAQCRALEFEKRQQWENAAQQYELAGNSEKAKECRAKLPVEYPEDAAAFGRRGNERLSNGDYHGAIADYNEVIKIKPDFGYAYHNRGVARHRLDDYAAAIEDYTKALELVAIHDVKAAKTYGYRGAARAALGDHQGALEDYNKVLEIDRSEISAYNNRAATRHRLGDYQGSIDDYSEVLRKDPTNALAFGNRGAAKSALGNHQGAIDDLTQAIKYNASLNQLFYHRGNAYLAVGNYQAAIQDFTAELQRNPEISQVHYKRGNAYLAVANYQAAIYDFNEEIKRNPDHAAAYSDRAIARSSLGDHHAAIDDLNRAVLINPNLAAAYNNRGAVRRDLGDTEGALEDYNKAISLNPNYADAFYNRGVSRSVLNDIEGAVADWNRAVQLNPNNPLAYYNLGVSKIQNKNYQGAIEDYTKAIEIAPEFGEAYFERGVTRNKLKERALAIKDLQKAAQIFTKRGDKDRLEETMEKLEKIKAKQMMDKV